MEKIGTSAPLKSLIFYIRNTLHHGMYDFQHF